MAENAIALKESTNDKKMIIWAHNGHVAKTSLYKQPAMGEYLDKKFGDKYYVIATISMKQIVFSDSVLRYPVKFIF